MKRRLALAAGLAAGIVTPVLAQNSDVAPVFTFGPRIAPSLGGVSDALGDVVAGPFDIQNTVAAPADNGCLGVVAAFGHLWVSGRGSTGTLAAHRIHKFTNTGTYVESYAQTSASAAWGGRDGAANESANLLYFGEELGRLNEYSYDPATQDITFVRFITLTGVTSLTVRALAFNPTNGHFYTADFGSAVTEFTIDPPTLVATYPSPGLALYGLAWEPVNNRLWGWSQNAVAAPSGPNFDLVKATELDPATLTPTGLSFDGALVPHGPTAPDNIAGGAEIMCNHPANPGELSLVAVHQSTPDVMVVYDLAVACGSQCYPDCNLSGTLTIADFACFQTAFVASQPYGDCNNSGTWTIADFACFQTAFVNGCP